MRDEAVLASRGAALGQDASSLRGADVEGVSQIEMFRGPFSKPEFLPVGMARGFQKWVLAEGEGEEVGGKQTEGAARQASQ